MAKTTTTLTQSVIPAWYTNYAQTTLANQQAVANKPFTPYEGDRVADFNSTQQQGLGLANEATTNYKGTLQSALDKTNAAGTRSTLGAAQPWINQAADNSGLSTAFNNLGQAGTLAQASTANLGQQAAQPYLDTAGQKATDDVSSYMNPYIENVINQYVQTGQRALSEKLLPEISDRYVNYGQSGFGPASTGMTTDSLRALRDVNDSVQSQALAAYSGAYDSALGASQTDKARQANLAATAGQLGTAQQGALQSAAGTFGQLGGQYADITQGQQGVMANLAGQVASAYGQDTANALTQSGQLAQLAQQQQGQALAGSQALSSIGQTQQQISQAEADAAYQEFQRENNYAQEQVNNMANTIGAVSPAVPNAQVSITGKTKPGTNTLGTLAGLAATYAGATR